VAVLVRDKPSLDVLEKLDVSTRVEYVADIAFLHHTYDWPDHYTGNSYHRVMAARLAGYNGVWNGERWWNNKFYIYKTGEQDTYIYNDEAVSLDYMRKQARRALDIIGEYL